MKRTPGWKKILAAVFAALFGLTLSFSLIAYNIEQRIFDPEIYKQVLIDQRVCEQFPMIVSRQILSSARSSGSSKLLGDLVSSIKPERMENFFKLILPCDVVESVVFSGIDQMFSLINQTTDQNSLPLSTFKESVRNNSKVAVDEYLNTLPDCSAATLLQMGANALFGQGKNNGIEVCNPPDALKDIFRVPLLFAVESAFQAVPDRVTLNQGLSDLFDLLRTTRTIMRFSFLVPLLFLGLTTILVVRSWRSLLRWWGYPLLAGGVVTLLVSLAVAPTVFATLSFLVLPKLPVTLVPEAVHLISSILAGVTRGLAAPIQVQSAVLSVIGLGMVIGERLMGRKT